MENEILSWLGTHLWEIPTFVGLKISRDVLYGLFKQAKIITPNLVLFRVLGYGKQNPLCILNHQVNHGTYVKMEAQKGVIIMWMKKLNNY